MLFSLFIHHSIQPRINRQYATKHIHYYTAMKPNDDIDRLYIQPIAFKIRDMIRNICMNNLKWSESAFHSYCLYNNIPRLIICESNDDSIDLSNYFDSDVRFTYNRSKGASEYLLHYNLNTVSEAIIDHLNGALTLIPIPIDCLNEIHTALCNGTTSPFHINFTHGNVDKEYVIHIQYPRERSRRSQSQTHPSYYEITISNADTINGENRFV
eukprot:328525_1